MYEAHVLCLVGCTWRVHVSPLHPAYYTVPTFFLDTLEILVLPETFWHWLFSVVYHFSECPVPLSKLGIQDIQRSPGLLHRDSPYTSLVH